LLAYDLAGKDAGIVLGTALAIKMIAYVTIGPVVGAFAHQFPRRGFLVCLDIGRAGIVLALPFVDQIWQVYVLVFLLQSGSAAFTPTFRATIPDVLTDEPLYTKGLSLSRIAYDLEMLLSPSIAGELRPSPIRQNATIAGAFSPPCRRCRSRCHGHRQYSGNCAHEAGR
jgi:MFS family permease